MARRKRVPFRPDAFQAHGRRMAFVILDRGRIFVVCLVLAAVGFIVAVVVMQSRATAEEDAWASLHQAGDETAKLKDTLADSASTSARPWVLFSLARAEIEPPLEDKKPKKETPEERKARFSRAGEALRSLVDEYPDHFMNLYALSLMGLVLEEEGRYQDAVDVLRRALDKAPKRLDPKIRYDIGRNYVLAGRANVPPAGRSGRPSREAVSRAPAPNRCDTCAQPKPLRLNTNSQQNEILS